MEKEYFLLEFKEEHFCKNNIVTNQFYNFKVVSEPKIVYKSFLHRIINYISFNLLCKPMYKYKVTKLVE